jgi:hypothetical protein
MYGEGRCLSECLGSVAAQASQLKQTTCSSGFLCTPCYDPFSGEATGACALSMCDAPVLPAYTFDTCCDDNTGKPGGTCVPGDLVPSTQSSSLSKCTGKDTAAYCVPDEYLPGSTTPIVQCGTANNPAVCLSNCVSGAGLLGGQNAACPSNHVCANCTLAKALGQTVPGCPP